MSEDSTKPYSIVLVGGIASGKSAIAALFAEHGAQAISADAIVHELLKTPAVAAEIRAAFGEGPFDPQGHVDRKRLATLVFPDADRLRRLEAILHSRVLTKIEEALAALTGPPPRAVAVLDVPLAAEVGLTARADLVVYIEVAEDERLARSARSRGWSPEDHRRREALQMPLQQKRALSARTVRNDRGLSEARDEIGRIWRADIEPALGAQAPG